MPDPIVIDGRDLLPPEPMELALAALDRLEAGQELLLLLHCEPHPLYSILKRNGYRYSSEMREDGCNAIHINKA